jgi:hypothetical protein
MYAKGLCQSHYGQQLRTGSLWPLGLRRQLRVTCDFEGCDKLATTRRLCPGHYRQLQKGQPLRPPRPFYPKAGCDFPGCERPHYALGYCQGHRRQVLDNRLLAPLRERRGRHMDRGYVLLYEPRHPNARKDGYVAEHTKVMAELLGRPLERFEEVHHKYGAPK